MAKKKRKEAPKGLPPVEGGESERITARGWKVIAAGALLLVAGFFVLTYTDPLGSNWASTLSPLLILGAYGVIAVGILLPEPSAAPEAPPGTQEAVPAATNSSL